MRHVVDRPQSTPALRPEPWRFPQPTDEMLRRWEQDAGRTHLYRALSLGALAAAFGFLVFR
jgi:hypothetical protein